MVYDDGQVCFAPVSCRYGRLSQNGICWSDVCAATLDQLPLIPPITVRLGRRKPISVADSSYSPIANTFRAFTTFVKYSAIYYEYFVNISQIFVRVVNSSYICCRTINCSVMAESAKRARFTKVASARVTKIINYLNLLQNCSNRNNYEYDSEDVELMFAEIGKALQRLLIPTNSISRRGKAVFPLRNKRLWQSRNLSASGTSLRPLVV